MPVRCPSGPHAIIKGGNTDSQIRNRMGLINFIYLYTESDSGGASRVLGVDARSDQARRDQETTVSRLAASHPGAVVRRSTISPAMAWMKPAPIEVPTPTVSSPVTVPRYGPAQRPRTAKIDARLTEPRAKTGKNPGCRATSMSPANDRRKGSTCRSRARCGGEDNHRDSHERGRAADTEHRHAPLVPARGLNAQTVVR